MKKAVRVDCLCTLGRCKGAEFFKQAVSKAMEARTYAQAVYAANEWVAAEGGEAAQAAIETACAQLGKPASAITL